jgi:hypothetical protein
MGRRNSKVGRHGTRAGATVYGTPDQNSFYDMTIKCQSSQVSGTCGRDKRDLWGPDVTT